MKKLNNFIIEKLKFNKDTKIFTQDNIEYDMIFPNYDKKMNMNFVTSLLPMEIHINNQKNPYNVIIDNIDDSFNEIKFNSGDKTYISTNFLRSDKNNRIFNFLKGQLTNLWSLKKTNTKNNANISVYGFQECKVIAFNVDK